MKGKESVDVTSKDQKTVDENGRSKFCFVFFHSIFSDNIFEKNVETNHYFFQNEKSNWN